MEAYPHMWEVDTSLSALISQYADLEDGARIDEVEVRIAGRVKSLRSSGAKLKFYDLAEGDERMQADLENGGFKYLVISVISKSRFLTGLLKWVGTCWHIINSAEVMCSPQMHEGEDFKEVHANINRGVS